MSSVNSSIISFLEQTLKKSNEELIQCTSMRVSAAKKVEERYVAIAKPCKIYTFVMAPKFKIVTTNHLLDLLEIKSTNVKELCLKFKSGAIQGDCDYPDDFLNAVVAEVERAFPGMGRTLFNLDVVPADRIVSQSAVDPDEVPCGGFASIYAAFASYNNVIPRADIMWHLENVSQGQSSKTLDLREFEGLTSHDLQALFMALKSNNYFTRIALSDLTVNGKLEKNAPHLDALMDVFRVNSTLVAIDCRGCVPKAAAAEIWPAMFNALASNKKIPMTSFELSDNVFDAAGIAALANWLQTMPSGLTELRMSNCGLDKKSLIPLCNAMKNHPKIRNSLCVLDLSNNKWDAECISALASMFASPTMISELYIRDSQAPLDSLLAALVRGCLELRLLDISGGHITSRGATQLCQWIKASSQLKRLNISQSEIPAESLAEVISSIGSNCYLTDVGLKAAMVRVGSGATRVALAVGKAPNIAVLDLSGDELGEDGVASLCAQIVGLGPQCALRRLVINGNLSSAGGGKDGRRNNPKATTALIALLSSDVPLESFSMRGGRAPASQPSPNDCTDIIYSLACKEAKLQELDLASCGMGNRGAVALGQMLQVNKSLRKLTWDHNGVTISGYRAFVKGLEHNRTLKVMPLPVKDIEAALAACPDGNGVIQSMQSALASIQNPQKLDTNVSFGSTAIITQDGRQDILEKEVAKLRRVATDSKAARALLEEPETQTLLDDCTRVQQMGSSFQLMREEVAGLLEGDMRAKLQALSKEFSSVVAQHKSQLASKMSEYIAQTFKTIESDKAQRLRIAIDYGTKTFDHVSLDKILVAAAGMEIESGASECFNSAVDLAMDFVYDKLMDSVKESTVTLQSAQLTETLEATESVPVSHKDRKEKEEKKEKKEKKEERKEESSAPPSTPPPPTPTSPSSAQPVTPSRKAPPVPPPASKKPAPGRVAANSAIAAALAAGPVSPSARRPAPHKPAPAEEEQVVSPTSAAPEKTEESHSSGGHKLFGRKEKAPAVKPAKTREISYKVSGNETVLGVACESNTEHTPALTHPTKGRAKGPAGRKGGARRPPAHKDYTLTDPTAQLQPTLL